MLNALIGYQMMNSETKDTLSAVATIFGSMLGSKLTSGIANASLLKMLRGEETAHPMLKSACNALLTLSENPAVMNSVINLGLNALDKQGQSLDKVLGMAYSVAPLMGTSMEAPSVEHLSTALTAVAKQVVNKSTFIEVNAVVVCPKCEHAFIV